MPYGLAPVTEQSRNSNRPRPGGGESARLQRLPFPKFRSLGDRITVWCGGNRVTKKRIEDGWFFQALFLCRPLTQFAVVAECDAHA